MTYYVKTSLFSDKIKLGVVFAFKPLLHCIKNSSISIIVIPGYSLTQVY